MRAEIWPASSRIVVDYDSGRMSQSEIGHWIQQAAPVAAKQFAKCTLHLHGRACAGCAIKLERKVEAIEGVHRATATFIGGTLAYAIAYLAGGWFGVQAGWQSLRLGAVDIDLLMILAALGAAGIGAPFEGAMLHFLFSLSNALQSLAIDRTRKAVQALVKLRPA